MVGTGKSRAAAIVAMVIGAGAASRAAGDLRLVEFLLLFFGGAAFGSGLTALLQSWRKPTPPAA